eukprot:6938006-Pyramimonas_sp.AAC.1
MEGEISGQGLRAFEGCATMSSRPAPLRAGAKLSSNSIVIHRAQSAGGWSDLGSRFATDAGTEPIHCGQSGRGEHSRGRCASRPDCIRAIASGAAM